jgi:hypothetical protein
MVKYRPVGVVAVVHSGMFNQNRVRSAQLAFHTGTSVRAISTSHSIADY